MCAASKLHKDVVTAIILPICLEGISDIVEQENHFKLIAGLFFEASVFKALLQLLMDQLEKIRGARNVAFLSE